MLLNIADILVWTGENPKQKNIHDAQRILTAGHLIKCGVNREKSYENTTVVTALCIQTSHLREKPHGINGNIFERGKFISVPCSCKAGKGEKCKHAVATLFYCYRRGNSTPKISDADKEIITGIFLNQRSELVEHIKNIKVRYAGECCQNTMMDYYEGFGSICAYTKLNYADWHKLADLE